MENEPSSIDRILEEHWSVLSFIERAVLLRDLGIDGKNEEILGGKNIVNVLQLGQNDLSSEVRSRLIMAVTVEGFTKEEYEKSKRLLKEIWVAVSNGEPQIDLKLQK